MGGSKTGVKIAFSSSVDIPSHTPYFRIRQEDWTDGSSISNSIPVWLRAVERMERSGVSLILSPNIPQGFLPRNPNRAVAIGRYLNEENDSMHLIVVEGETSPPLFCHLYGVEQDFLKDHIVAFLVRGGT